MRPWHGSGAREEVAARGRGAEEREREGGGNGERVEAEVDLRETTREGGTLRLRDNTKMRNTGSDRPSLRTRTAGRT
jgi:hypothetical protein